MISRCNGLFTAHMGEWCNGITDGSNPSDLCSIRSSPAKIMTDKALAYDSIDEEGDRMSLIPISEAEQNGGMRVVIIFMIVWCNGRRTLKNGEHTVLSKPRFQFDSGNDRHIYL